jgi:hypothetical protein
MRSCPVTLVVLGCFLIVACERLPTEDQTPRLAISDAVHGGGNAHFFFLPPMVPEPEFSGEFDPALSPVVVITGPGGFSVTLTPLLMEPEELYQVEWHTNQYDLSAGEHYCITVTVGDVSLGFADVVVAETMSAFKNINTGEYIPLKDGRTLPIKFRIEEGALVGSDVEAPRLVDLAFSATTVDLSGGAVDVLVTFAITDVGMGANQAYIGLSATTQGTSCGAALAGGDVWNGTWVCALTFPAGSEAGVWSVSYVQLRDAAGNATNLALADLEAAGLPTTIMVTY